MAFTDITEDGAIGFNFVVSIDKQATISILHMASGEHYITPAALTPDLGWTAFHYRKSSSPIAAINGIVDLAPYIIDWVVNLDNHQADGLEHILVSLNEKSQHLVRWRQALSEAEHQAMLSGTFAAISGVSAVACGIGFVGDLLTGGVPVVSGLLTLGSTVACGANLGQLEAAAKRGDLCVRAINGTVYELIDLGRQIDLPFCVPHQTPIIQSACTQLAQAFGVKGRVIRASQAGFAKWLEADLRFHPA